MMRHRRLFSSGTLILLFAVSTFGQVVVVAPAQPARDPLHVEDPYGACLPNLAPGATGCKPNPFYRPDYTVGVLDPTAVYQQNAAAQQQTETQRALATLAAELESLRLQQLGRDLGAAASAQQQDAQRNALARVIQAQNTLEAQYRATWPRWMEHWTKTAPTITDAATKLAAAASDGSSTRGCGAFVAFNDELRVAIPPSPGNIIAGLHAALYEMRQQCLGDPGNAVAVRDGAVRLRGEVEMLSEWAEGRSSYYAALPR